MKTIKKVVRSIDVVQAFDPAKEKPGRRSDPAPLLTHKATSAPQQNYGPSGRDYELGPVSLTRSAFAENPLQRAPVHTEPACSFRDVMFAQIIDSLNVLPTDAVRGHRIVWRRGLAAILSKKRSGNIVGIGRLGEVIDHPELHGRNCVRDIAVASEHNALGIGTAPLQRRDDVETIAFA